MAIRVEHQPSPAVVGMAAYYAGYAGRKKREQEQAQQNRMTLYRDQQQTQARREGQAMDFLYGQELNRQRNAAAAGRFQQQHEWDVAEDKQQHTWDVEEAKEKRTAEDEDFLAKQYGGLSGQLDEIVKEGGGHVPPGNAEAAKFWDDVAAFQRDAGKMKESDRFTRTEKYKALLPRLQELLSRAKPDYVVNWSDRPGSRRTTDSGEIWERSRDPSKPDTFVDFADEGPMSDEDIRAGKSKRFRYIGGALQQRVMGRTGSKWEAVDAESKEGMSPKDQMKMIYDRAQFLTPEGGTPSEHLKEAEDWFKDTYGGEGAGAPVAPGGATAPSAPGSAPAAPTTGTEPVPEIVIGPDGKPMLTPAPQTAAPAAPAAQSAATTPVSAPAPTKQQQREANERQRQEKLRQQDEADRAAKSIINPPAAPVEERTSAFGLTPKQMGSDPELTDFIKGREARQADLQERRANVGRKSSAEASDRQLRMFLSGGPVPDGAVTLPDGTVMIGGRLYRRRQK